MRVRTGRGAAGGLVAGREGGEGGRPSARGSGLGGPGPDAPSELEEPGHPYDAPPAGELDSPPEHVGVPVPKRG